MVKEKFRQTIKKDISVQEWLDSEYPKEKKILERKREDIIGLDISKKGLEGSLKLEDFPNLNKFKCNNNQLTNLEIINCPELEVIYCHDNQLIELSVKDCPNLKKICCERNKLIELNFGGLEKLIELQCYNNQIIKLDLISCFSLEKFNCRYNQLINLKLDNCSELKEIYCSDNQLITLGLTNLNQLRELDCSDNYLQDLNFLSSLQVKQLIRLNVMSNDFPEQDCSIFKRFINLRRLSIGNNNEKKINQGIYNRFYGSLEPLHKLGNLYELDIDNTDINSGLTYLSESVEYFYYSVNLRKDAQVKIISNLLTSEEGQNFSQKLKSIKQGIKPKIDQVIFLVEQLLVTDKIDTLDLWKELKFNYEVDAGSTTWQDYLSSVFSLHDLNTRKDNVFEVLENLKSLKEIALVKEKQTQEELIKQKEGLEKKIRELETKQLTENEKRILQKLEELFVALDQIDDESIESIKKITKISEDYKNLDFNTDTPNLSEIFKSGSKNLFYQIGSFIAKINERISNSQKELQTEITRLLAELKKVDDSRQELVTELAKKDSEISDLQVKRKELRIEIDSLQEKIQNDEKELELFPGKISNTKIEIEGHLRESVESTRSLRKKKKELEEEENKLQKSVEKSRVKLIKLEKEEKRLQKLLDKVENDLQKADANIKIKIVQEQIEKLQKELASQSEVQNLVAQIEIKNNFNQ